MIKLKGQVSATVTCPFSVVHIVGTRRTVSVEKTFDSSPFRRGGSRQADGEVRNALISSSSPHTVP